MNASAQAKVPESSGILEAVNQLAPSEREQMNNLLGKLKALGAEFVTPTPDAAGPKAAAAAAVLPAGNSATTKETDVNTTVASPTGLAHNTSNQLTLDQMIEIAAAAGADTAKGNDSLTKLLMKVAEGAFVGALDATKDKHGPGVDDAAKISEAFAKARSKTNIFDAKADKARKQASITRTMIRLGGYTKGGTGEPLTTLNTLMTLRNKLRQDSGYAKRVEDPVNCMIRFARAQLKLDHMIDQTGLQEFALKVDHNNSRQIADWWDSVRAQAKKLQLGKLRGCADSDTSAEIDTLIKTCNRRLKTIADALGPQPGDAKTANKQAKAAAKAQASQNVAPPVSPTGPAPQATQTANAA